MLAADVDAAGWLVHEEDVAVVVDHSRQRDLLLVAAGEGADWLVDMVAAHAEPRGETVRGRFLFAQLEEAAARGLADCGEGGVRGDAEVLGEAFVFTVLAEVIEPAVEGGDRSHARELERCASFELDGAGGDRVEPEQAAREFGAPGADQAEDAEDFAALQLEGHAAR